MTLLVLMYPRKRWFFYLVGIIVGWYCGTYSQCFVIGLAFSDLAIHGSFERLKQLGWKTSALINFVVLALIFVFVSVPFVSNLLDFGPWYIQVYMIDKVG